VQATVSSCTAWPEREEPITVKAKPFGRAMRGLDGFKLGETSMIDVHRYCKATSLRTRPVPPGLPSHCVRRQTRRPMHLYRRAESVKIASTKKFCGEGGVKPASLA
jgi:hypothetical protein